MDVETTSGSGYRTCVSNLSSFVVHYEYPPLDLPSHPSSSMRQFAQRGKHGCAIPFLQAISTSTVVSRQRSWRWFLTFCILYGSQSVSETLNGYICGLPGPADLNPTAPLPFPHLLLRS